MPTFRSVALFLLLVPILIAPAQAQQDRQQSAQPPLPLDEVRIFTEALDRIRMSYVEPIDDATLLEYAIRGMLAGLDPHSSYLAGNEFDSLQETTTGEFGGLGIEVGRENGFIKVISPIDDTPAYRAGIKAGDLIIQINNKPLQEMLPEEASQMMRGEPGTDVTVTIAREGSEPFDLTITREVIAINSVRNRWIEPGYGYLRISQFRLNTGDEVEKALASMRDEAAASGGLKGIVLDLRNNPGGVLQASVAVVDHFISEGTIVYTKGRITETDMVFEATDANPGQDTPLIVLINGGSASASEIVAGALQDHGRAIIMGTRSFGKGSVQTVMPLTDQRAIKLTTSLYYTPNGRSIQAQGIAPDIEVDEALVTRRARNTAAYNEADLAGHLENGNEASDQELVELAMVAAERVVVNDYPLNEALNLLKGINAFKPIGEFTLR